MRMCIVASLSRLLLFLLSLFCTLSFDAKMPACHKLFCPLLLLFLPPPLLIRSFSGWFYLCSYLVCLLISFCSFGCCCCCLSFFCLAVHIENAKDFYTYLRWMQLLFTNCDGLASFFCGFSYAQKRPEHCRGKRSENERKIDRQTDIQTTTGMNSQFKLDFIILNSLNCSQYTLDRASKPNETNVYICTRN